MGRFIQLCCLVIVSVLAFTRGECPEQYKEGPGGHCYVAYYSTYGSTWDSARGTCAFTNNSDLVIIDDQAEYDWLLNLTTTEASNSSWWIGYHDNSAEGDWRWVDCGETTEWHRTLWSSGNHDNQADDCGVLLPSGEIDDIVCDTKINYFVCEVSPKDFLPDEASPTNLRANVSSTLTVTLMWDVSSLSCDVYAYMIRVTDDQMVTSTEIVYGGDTNEVDVSLGRVRTQYSFTVAALTIMDGELPETESAQATTDACPDAFEESPGGRCYRFRSLTNGEWWPAGRRSCDNTQDGDLVIINDEEEWSFIMNRTSEIDPDAMWWIGLSDLTSDDDWRWVDCSEPIDWQNRLWAPGYPTMDDKDCAILLPNGTIQNNACDLRINSICEISPKAFDGDALMVTDVMISGSSTTSLDVTWSLPRDGCDAVGYRIYYSMTDTMEEKQSIFVQGGDVTHGVVPDLRANTQYNVSVAVYTSKDNELGESQAAQGTTMACPADYEEGPNGHCYWFGMSDYGDMWYWGRLDCSDQPDSDLVIINDEEEMEFLRNRTSELSTQRDWWVGLSSSPEWSWVDCEEPNPWQDSLWAPGNPRPDSYGCTVLDDSGDLVDVGCDTKHHFICEIYPRGFTGEDQNVQDIAASPLMYGMEVSWTLAPKHCDVDHYKVSYTEDMEGAEELDALQYDDDSTSTTVTGLYPNTTYNVTVAAVLYSGMELNPVGPVQVTTLECPDNYELGPNGRCYRFRLADPGSWWASGRRVCDNVVDSDLVIIDDEIEFDFLMNRTVDLDPNENWWIGYSDQSVEGDWRWIDCEASNTFQRTLWAPGYPGNGAHDCAALRPSGDIVDLVCDESLSYICEISPKGFDYDDINPHDLAATGVTYGLEVTWTPSPTSCDAIGYRVAYQLDQPGSSSEFVIAYGGSAQSVTAQGLLPGRAYNVSVAAILNQDYELYPTETVTATTLPCPDGYEESPNGHCYRFRIRDPGFGSWWSTGRRVCDNELESDLAIINDQMELDFLMNRTAEIDASIMWWIGYSDQSVEGDWRWIDCTESSAWQNALWAPDHPGNGRLDCAALQPDGQIVDLVCDEPLSYICEISLKGFDYDDINPHDLAATGVTYGLEVTWTPSPTSCDVIGYRVVYQLDQPGSSSEFVMAYGGNAQSVTAQGLLPGRAYNVSVAAILNQDYELYPTETVTATTLPCPDGYEESPNGRCYRFRIRDPGFGSWWSTGRRVCDNELDSDLAIINDQMELDFLMNRTAEIDASIMWWIGYSDQSVEGDWRWIDCTESSAWQDALWVPDHPGNGRLDCAALQPDGRIVDLVCDTPLSYLCEVSPRGFSQEDGNPRDLAVMGTTYGLEVTWTLSPTSCDVVGYRISYYLTGDISTRTSIVVYGGDTSSAVVDGLPVNTTYDVTVAAFISKDIELSPVGPLTATTDACPEGYDLAPNGRCYLFIQDDPSFWHYSRQTCWFQKDSDLAIINDQAELDYIMQQITDIGDDKAWWLGYSDISVEGDWKWVDCTESDDWQMNLWAPGSPGNQMMDCGLLTSSGEVEDNVCDMRLNYVCEVSPKGFNSYELKLENLETSGASYGVDVSWSLPENNCDVYGYNIYYQEMDSDMEQNKILYGGDTVGSRIQGLLPNTTLNISVAILIVDDELERVGPIVGQSDPCPTGYEEAANGRCYWFQDFGRLGNDWVDTRFYCSEAADNFDHDLMIIDDEWELEYITNRTREFNDSRDWRIGYSDLAEEGVWKWVTCESPDTWQQSLWAPSYPQNGLDDCGVFDPDTMTIYNQVCDVLDISYICEVTPKDFTPGEDNVFNLNATVIAWDTIRVTWNVSEYNCDVIAYNIFYMDTFLGGQPKKDLVYGGAVESYDLTMLEPITLYSISVSAERQDQELPQVDPVYATTPEGPCPPYYVVGPSGGCYRFVTSEYGSAWTSGRSGCGSIVDSDLVVIDDQMEFDFIVNHTKEFDSKRNWWIGFSDHSVESDWRWVTCDTPTDWQNNLWESGYPGNGDCGALSSSSRQVVDAACDDRKYYICEITPKGFTNADMNVHNVMASPVSSSEIEVTWMLSNVTCNVYAYKIYYGIQGEPFKNTQFNLAYGGNMTSITIPGLSPSLTYTFYVAALIPDRLELPRIGPTNATTYSECQRTIVDQDGMIMNVDYPNGYAGPDTCEWLISAPIDQYVLLQILDFDTRSGTDLVVIGSGIDFASETTLYVLSGSKANAGGTPIPDKILSPGQNLWISFKTSESSLDNAGFRMQVTMVTQGPGEPERLYDQITEEGTLSSPGWPDQYTNFVDLTWTLIAPKTGRVRITSLEGILESNYDTLTIGYGNPDSSILNTYTGDFELDETLESPTYNFWVRFQADETVSDKGFTLYWESFEDQDSCGTQELLEASGTVMSPNYPQPYPDNQECTWLIRLPSMDQLVRVEFTAFSLEKHHDFLLIGTGKIVNEEVISVLTGDLSLAPVVSESYRMWLQFKSDESFSATGFSLEYSGIDNPNPPTEYNEITDTVIFIVQDEPLGWFTPTNQENLANAIATSMTDYCMDKSDTCEENVSERRKRDAHILQLTFSMEDVEFLDTVAVDGNLHITLWVRNPSMVGEDVIIGIEPEIVQTSLEDETSQATIKETMGESFGYSVTPNVQTPTDEPPEPPPGLEPWAISLIVVASVAVVVTAVVGLEVRHRRKMKQKSFDTSDPSTPIHGLDEPDYAVPLRTRSSAADTGQENYGFEGDNTKL